MDLTQREWAFPYARAALYQGLKENGFVEGKNIHIEFREMDGDYDRLRSFAARSGGRLVRGEGFLWVEHFRSGLV